MREAASAFFGAWSAALDEGIVGEGEIRFQARGTSYARAGQGARTLAPLVAGSRLEPWVEEIPDRLSYSGTLETLVRSDALVVFGSMEPAYTASKIHPYLLSGRPVLALFHEKSPVVALMRAVGGGVLVTFDERTTGSQLSGGDPRSMVQEASARAARPPRPRGARALLGGYPGAGTGRLVSQRGGGWKLAGQPDPVMTSVYGRHAEVFGQVAIRPLWPGSGAAASPEGRVAVPELQARSPRHTHGSTRSGEQRKTLIGE